MRIEATNKGWTGNLLSQVGISNGLTWGYSYDNADELTAGTEKSGNSTPGPTYLPWSGS